MVTWRHTSPLYTRDLGKTLRLRNRIFALSGSRSLLALCKEIHIPESKEFLPVESGILGFEIRNSAQGIRNPTTDWNPESKFHCQRLESSTWNLESGAWNPGSRTVLDSLTWMALLRELFMVLYLSLARMNHGKCVTEFLCYISSRVTFLVLHIGDHVWSTWSCDNFSIENRFWWQCTFEVIVILVED